VAENSGRKCAISSHSSASILLGFCPYAAMGGPVRTQCSVLRRLFPVYPRSPQSFRKAPRALLLIAATRTDYPLRVPYDRAMTVGWKDRIVSDPAILRGKPHLKGTHTPVSLVLGYLAAGSSPDQIMAELPDLTPIRSLPASIMPAI
jgi:uncharacterized protein (DUF433 family)